jgi:hypothetical protein
VNDFDDVAFQKSDACMLPARDDFEVALDCHRAPVEPEVGDELANGDALRNLAWRAVDLELHARNYFLAKPATIARAIIGPGSAASLGGGGSTRTPSIGSAKPVTPVDAITIPTTRPSRSTSALPLVPAG